MESRQATTDPKESGNKMKKPDIKDRVKKANAHNEERKSQEYERIQEVLSIRKESEELQEWLEFFRFEIALTAFQIVQMLENQRDDNLPQPPDFEWNSLFCEAILNLPEAKRFAQDCLYDCMIEKTQS